MVTIRRATVDDRNQIAELHRKVARISQGIARSELEITDQYVDGLLLISDSQGLMLVAFDSTNQLVAEIHATKYNIQIFDHILTGLTIVVHPDYQSKGVGKRLFRHLLTKYNRPFPKWVGWSLNQGLLIKNLLDFTKVWDLCRKAE